MTNEEYQNNRLSPKWRKLLLTMHVVVSVGLIGADLTVIILGIAGLTSGTPEIIQASYLAMELLVETALVPLALGAFLTGILLGVGTHWGLIRYYWVFSKLILMLTAVTALVFLLRPRIHQVAAEILQVPPGDLTVTVAGPLAIAVTIGPSVALLILITTAILGIYKPWGSTRFRGN